MHMEIEDVQAQLENIVAALADGRLAEVILCRKGVQAARLIGAADTAATPQTDRLEAVIR